MPTLVDEPQPKCWSKGEYYRLAEQGYFHGQRVELIGGQLMVLSPQDWEHTKKTIRAFERLRTVFSGSAWVRSQLPLDLGEQSEPEPDISVVPGLFSDYSSHPTSALLVVEISNTSLRYDRGRKASLYARAGINDYWIVSVHDRQLIVLRDPQPATGEPFGHAYASSTTLRPGDTVTPLALPDTAIAVAELFE